VETDDGIQGYGEGSYGLSAQIIRDQFASAIIGLDALDSALVRRHCVPDAFDFGTPNIKTRLAAWGAIELALWDILGKQAGLPVYRLLGGAVRPLAPFGAYAYTDQSESSALALLVDRAITQVQETGASIFEFKVGVHAIDVEVEIIRAVYEALEGRAQIAIDANLGMKYDDARRLLQRVSPLIENFEEPVASLDLMQRLADEFHIHVSTHCCEHELMRHYPAIDGIVPTLDSCGGIGPLRRLAHIFGAMGKRVWIRSHAEAGIGWAAIVHLGLSTPELERPAQCLIDLLEDDLVTGPPWLVRDGGVRPPERPGLGVDLDLDAVSYYHRLYLAIGEVQAFPAAGRRP
jgi:glucarate dehydratase